MFDGNFQMNGADEIDDCTNVTIEKIMKESKEKRKIVMFPTVFPHSYRSYAMVQTILRSAHTKKVF